MTIPLLHVDAFTDRSSARRPRGLFSGNPAAVCLLQRPAERGWMQMVAREMNLSETAFVAITDVGALNLRWFTPAVEVDLCGHATLAAAHALWETGCFGAGVAIRFDTASGELGARRDGAWIELDFPAEPAVPAPAPGGLLEALGITARAVARNRLDWLVEVESPAVVRAVVPDMARLASVPTRGVIVTAQGDRRGCDFVSRFFAPRAGIPEDPVTGSAHCALGPWWGARLGRQALVGYQVSARGGTVRVRLRGARVGLGGCAVTVARGTLRGAP